MDSKTFFDNFETIVNAPGGIARLRELILDLAVNGKLVPQTGEWQECLLGEIAQIRTGKLDANASSSDGRYPFFTCAKDPLRIDSFTYDTECVLLAGNGNFDVNYYSGKFDAYQRTYIIEAQDEKQLFIPFLFRFMQGHSQKLLDQAIGGVIRYIKIGFLTQAQFLLPSLEEQKRIVTKVDELMALCEELDAAQNQRDSIRSAIRKSAIDAISTATTPDELNTAWKRISDNWLTVADTPESITSLRSLILDLAVRGKLVSTLEKPAHSEARFIELGSVMTLEYGKPLDKSLRTIKGQIPVYGANGVKAMTGMSLVKDRGIVVGRKGSAGEVNITDGPFWPLDVTFFAKFDRDAFDLQYLYYLLKSLDLPKMARGIKPGINRNDVNKLKVLTVKLAEQKRIVAKVDELMALCDELEHSLLERKELTKKIAGSLASEVAA